MTLSDILATQKTNTRYAYYEGMAAAGALLIISSVALGIIFAISPSLTVAFPQIIAWSSLAAITTATLIGCVISYYQYRKNEGEQREDFNPEDLIDSLNFETIPIVVSREPSRDQRLREASTVSSQRTSGIQSSAPSERNSAILSQVDLSPELEENLNEASSIQTESHPSSRVSSRAPSRPVSIQIPTSALSLQEPLPEEAPPLSNQEQGNPLPLIKEDILPPLLDGLGNALKEVVLAHGRKINESHFNSQTTSDQVDQLIEETKSLFIEFLEEPDFYLTELLVYFGPGKIKAESALRQLIVLKNSGDEEKYFQKRAEFQAIKQGNDFSDLAALLRDSRSNNPAILAQFPEIMANHFSLIDEDLKSIGMNLLNRIFSDPNEAVKTEWDHLKRKAPQPHCSQKKMVAFAKDVENFIYKAFHEANLSADEKKVFFDQVVGHMLQKQFMETLRLIIGIIGLNMRLLPQLFDRSAKTNEIHMKLDETFLLSESREHLHPNTQHLQQQLFVYQSKINVNRSKEKRIAFIVFPKNDQRPYAQIARDEEIVNFCLELSRGYYNLKELEGMIKNTKDHRLIPVPIHITDHPYKEFLTVLHAPNILVRGAFNLIQRRIPTKVKEPMYEVLPKFSDEQKSQVDHLFDRWIDLLLKPFYNGALNHKSPFHLPFTQAIQTHGSELATQLETLANQEEELRFENIRDQWVSALQNIAQIFREL